MSGPIARVTHLVRRFIGSFRSRELTAEQVDWVRTQLTPPEFELFGRMTPNDQAHSVEVAEAVAASAPPDSPDPAWVPAAALLHDVGKVDSGATTFERVAATVIEPWAPAQLTRRMAGGPGPVGRVGKHITYPEVGASMLATLGSHEHVCAWAAQHHRSESEWTVPVEYARRLRAADDAAS